MNNNKFSRLFTIIACIITLAYPLGVLISRELKYLLYIPIIIPLIVLYFTKGIIKKNNLNFISIVPFVIILSTSILRPFQLSLSFIQQFLIISSATLPFLVTDNFKANIYIINVFLIISFFLTVGININLNLSYTSFLESKTSSAETNQHPFIFGLFILFFIYKKNYTWFFINLFMLLLSFKRIVFLATLVTIPIVLFNKSFLNQKYKVFLTIAINIIFLFFSYGLATGLFDSLIQEYTGISAGYFTQGRTSLWGTIINYISTNKINLYITGGGLGYINEIMKVQGRNDLIHNDVLKIIIENGIFIFIAFFYSMYKYSKYVFLTIYLNILFFTDNTFVYALVLFFYFLLNHELILDDVTSTEKNP